MRVKKIRGIFILLVFLVAAMPTFALASVTPYWTNASSIDAGLSFSNGKGALRASIVGKPGTSSIEATAILEKKNSNGTYTEVEAWDDLSENGSVLSWDTIYYVSRGYTYRLKVTATVVRDGVSETVSCYKSAYAD